MHLNKKNSFCRVRSGCSLHSCPNIKLTVNENSSYLTGGDNSNKRCFGTKPKLLRESGDFSGNRDTWKFFRETRDNSGTLQKKILEFMSGILKISGKVTQKFGRMIQISGTTYVKTQ